MPLAAGCRTPRTSGEDFYFLQKLTKHGRVLHWRQAWQHCSDRRAVCEADQACLQLLSDVTDLDLRIIDRGRRFHRPRQRDRRTGTGRGSESERDGR